MLTGKARAAWGISEENLLDLFWLWHWFQRKCQKVHSSSSAFWFWCYRPWIKNGRGLRDVTRRFVKSRFEAQCHWQCSLWHRNSMTNNNVNLMLQLLLTCIVGQTIRCHITSISSGPDKSGSWRQHKLFHLHHDTPESFWHCRDILYWLRSHIESSTTISLSPPLLLHQQLSFSYLSAGDQHKQCSQHSRSQGKTQRVSHL